MNGEEDNRSRGQVDFDDLRKARQTLNKLSDEDVRQALVAEPGANPSDSI